MLLGFTYDERLDVVALELHRWPGQEWSDQVYDDIRALIADLAVELAYEDAQAAALLRGRTFRSQPPMSFERARACFQRGFRM